MNLPKDIIDRFNIKYIDYQWNNDTNLVDAFIHYFGTSKVTKYSFDTNEDMVVGCAIHVVVHEKIDKLIVKKLLEDERRLKLEKIKKNMNRFSFKKLWINLTD